MSRKLPLSFYTQEDVLSVAAALMGKILYTHIDGIVTAGRIVECEAYRGVDDRASHAAGGRRTARTEIMYATGGKAYVYLCYGIHYLFNVVTNQQDIPHAILIRALEPLSGQDAMMKRSGKKAAAHTLTKGPGNLSKAMGIQVRHSGLSLLGDTMHILDDGFRYAENEIARSPRIGVDYAGEDARLPYRFYVKGHPFVSGKPNK
ncbi:MAG: DNA-3-methyladenine glycosylase [Terrimonas sp.]|nr:DNA-3-methyladenine glycosylase [Terrimonas sp.]